MLKISSFWTEKKVPYNKITDSFRFNWDFLFAYRATFAKKEDSINKY